VPARLIKIKYITIRAEKVASPVTALHMFIVQISLKLATFSHVQSTAHITILNHPN